MLDMVNLVIFSVRVLCILSVRSPSLWNAFDLDCILSKGNQLFKFIGKFRYLWIDDLPQEFLIENPEKVIFLENKTGKITAGSYLLSITETLNYV